jgi:hypothetical protein
MLYDPACRPGRVAHAPGPQPRVATTKANNNINGVSRSMKQLFSAYGAARVLEVDRETVRGLAPDGCERKQPRWRLARIVEALSQRTGRASPSTDQALQDRFARLDALDARVRAASTLEQRQKLARELFVMLQDVDRAMRDDARRSGEDARLTGLRCEEHVRAMLATLRGPCGWNFEEMLGKFNRVAEAV